MYIWPARARFMDNQYKKNERLERFAQAFDLVNPDLSNHDLRILNRLFLLGKIVEKQDLDSPVQIFSSESNILFALLMSPNLKLLPSQLMTLSMLTSGALTAALNRLIKLGFIKRSRDAIDKRKLWVQLNAKGKEEADKIKAARLQFAQSMLEGFDELEKIRFLKLLEKL